MGLSDNSGNSNPSSPYLPKIRPDQTLTPSFVGKMIRGIDASTPRFGSGYQVANYSTGSVLRLPTPFSMGAPQTNFFVYLYKDEKLNITYAIVSVGTVNRCIPQIDNKYLDQLMPDGLPPKIALPDVGYIVIEAKYEANKPFPSSSVIKWVKKSDLNINSETNTSQYPLASIETTIATAKSPKAITCTQIHLQGNVAVNRFKIGASKYYWQWYTV